MTATSDDIERVRTFVELAETDPASAIEQRDQIEGYLFHSDEQVRALAAEVVDRLASKVNPLSLRPIAGTLASRADDTSPPVRARAFRAIARLAEWYPQDFATTTPLLVAAVEDGEPDERREAARALATIAFYRPDIVTPLEGARDVLASVEEESSTDIPDLEGAQMALRGGDIASRPLDSDLVPPGDRLVGTRSARMVLASLLAIPTMYLGFFYVLATQLYLTLKYDDYRERLMNKTLIGRKPITLILTGGPSGHLALRRSLVLVPSQILRYLPGDWPARRPAWEDPSTPTGDYPENWELMAQLIYARDDYTCRNCLETATEESPLILHADHFKPRSKGGEDHPRNLRTLCEECHEARHGRRFS